MGAAIAGLLIMAVFFSGALMMFRSTLFGNVLIGNAMKETIRISAERARTSVSIPTTSIQGGCTLKVGVKNVGATSLSEFSRMDVIVQFIGASNAAQRLQYTAASPPASGKWAKSFGAGEDTFDPGILNPGETMTIEATLTVAQTDTGAVIVGTSNGVTATASFPTVTPCP